MNQSSRTLLVVFTFLIAGLPALARHRRYVGRYFFVPPVYISHSFGRNGAVDCDVSPEDARVYVDGRERGEADDFDGFPGYLKLRPGRHRIEFRAPGRRTLIYKVDIHRGWLFDIDEEMEAGDPEDALVRRSGPPPGYRHRRHRDRRDPDRYDRDRPDDQDQRQYDRDREDDRRDSDVDDDTERDDRYDDDDD